ncbi:MAG TPA: hypothetical protein VFZ09_22700 [Archangium sp.]|uniref:hypothetical protein n=1 Tax=Archangium sp. TaxID=1872627 RepID=UPI002E3148FA|nr:hypothetical protein [Archangium sp.]HEX5749069.1 hypothetical protein [Archangium sp.]
MKKLIAAFAFIAGTALAAHPAETKSPVLLAQKEIGTPRTNTGTGETKSPAPAPAPKEIGTSRTNTGTEKTPDTLSKEPAPSGTQSVGEEGAGGGGKGKGKGKGKGHGKGKGKGGSGEE